jgi:hypothetical protein
MLPLPALQRPTSSTNSGAPAAATMVVATTLAATTMVVVVGLAEEGEEETVVAEEEEGRRRQWRRRRRRRWYCGLELVARAGPDEHDDGDVDSFMRPPPFAVAITRRRRHPTFPLAHDSQKKDRLPILLKGRQAP